MHILLYDVNLWGNYFDRGAILFYINNGCKQIYCDHTWSNTRHYFAQLEQNSVFRGQIELEDSARHFCSSIFLTPVFQTMFGRKPIQVSQTVLMAKTSDRIADDAKIKEILNVYNVSEELDPSFNVYDTIEVMKQCNDIDTLRLYMLSTLPYLTNCCVDDIAQFADIYNNSLWRILV